MWNWLNLIVFRKFQVIWNQLREDRLLVGVEFVEFFAFNLESYFYACFFKPNFLKVYLP